MATTTESTDNRFLIELNRKPDSHQRYNKRLCSEKDKTKSNGMG